MKDNVSLQTSLQAITLVLLALDVAVYLLFKRVAVRLTGSSRPRIIGSTAVLAFSIFVAWWHVNSLANESILASLSPQRQGEYVGRIAGVALVPAFLVLAVVAVRGWLGRRKGAGGSVRAEG